MLKIFNLNFFFRKYNKKNSLSIEKSMDIYTEPAKKSWQELMKQAEFQL